MSANPAAADAAAKPGNKKPLIIGLLVVVLLAAAAAAWFVKSRQAGHDEDDEDGAAPQAAQQQADAKAVPTFLPMENMVVNLADQGGDRFAQIGITLELADDKTAERVKAFLPVIRSGILIAVSQRTSAELLSREGKDKLAADVLREVSRPLGLPLAPGRPKAKPREEAGEAGEDVEEDDPPPRRAPAASPVRRVLFSSFIIQ